MLHTTPDDAWDVILRVHVRAPFRLLRAAAPHMRIKVSRSAERVRCVSASDNDVGACVVGQHGEPVGDQCVVDVGLARECGPGELRGGEGGGDRSDEDGVQGVGPVRRAGEHGCLRACPDAVRVFAAVDDDVTRESNADGVDRLTAAKEDGASIEIDGKKVALGIPGAGKNAAMAHAFIPLGRGATPDEAAGGVLL